MRLRTILPIAAAVLGVFVPLVLFAALWVHSEVDKNKRLADGFLTSQMNALAQGLDAEVSRHIAMLKAAAILPSLDGPDIESFRAQAERMLTTMPEWVGLELVDASDGRQLAEVTSPRHPFRALRARGRDMVQRVREKLAPLVQTVPDFHDRPGVERLISLSQPVAVGNDLRFVIVALVRPDALQHVLAQDGGHESLMTAVVDEEGHVLARSKPGGRGRLEAVLARLKEATHRQPVGLLSTAELEDRDLLSATVRSPLTGWTAIAATDPQPFSGVSRRVAWTMVGAGAMSLLLTGVLVVYLLHTLLERRVDAERLAASQAVGELDARLLATSQAALTQQRKASSEREVLLREIHHRVKNNLQIIQSLLRLGSRELRGEQREPFESAVRRIGVMARVHTLLYASSDLASIDLKDYLEGLLTEMSQAFYADARSISTELRAERMRIPLDTAVPLAFIVAELLTNAFQHAFPDGHRGGKITVEASRRGDDGVLAIADDGVGLAATRQRSALGLTMVGKLVQQIGGTLDSVQSGATRFTLVFPLVHPLAPALPEVIRPSQARETVAS